MDGQAAEPFAFRILYVDDDQALADLYAELLRSRGYEVHVVHSGFAALAALRQGLPDLVISDLCMPGMSGMELLAVIRQRFPRIPLLAVSGNETVLATALAADATLNRASPACDQVYDLIVRLLQPPATRPGLRWVASAHGAAQHINCPECLRSFRFAPAAAPADEFPAVHICACAYCGASFPFIAGEEADAA